MTYSQSQLDVLEAALASGALTVEYDGRRVTYRSVAELKEAIAEVRTALDAASGKTRVRQIRVYSSKGV